MKKLVFRVVFTVFVATVVAVLMLAVSFGASGASGGLAVFASQPDISIYVDGEVVYTDVPPQIVNGRTLIPVRAVSEAVGCEVEWVSAGQQVVVHLPGGSSTLTMQIDNPVAQAVIQSGGAPVEESIEIDSPPLLVDGRTLVPIRFIAEFIGFEVDWNATSRTVLLSSPQNSPNGSTTGSNTGSTTGTQTGGSGSGQVIENFEFSMLSGVEFWFGSGAGAWSTTLEISADGSFSGTYHDSEMGSIGEGYPNGSMYLCNFSGKFSSLTKVSDYEYSMKCESLTQEGTPDEEEIIDGVRVITSTPYGMDDADEFRLYLPGRTIIDLPKDYIEWVMNSLDGGSTLSYCGLYNVAGKQGYTSSGELSNN